MSCPILDLFIPGTPKPQPRPRAFARNINGKAVARVYDAGSAEAWKGAVALFCRQAGLSPSPYDGPVSVSLHFLLPRPKSLMRASDPDDEIPHTGRGDVDNLAKAVLDALTEIGVWRDDGQVVGLHVTKAYAAKTGRPGAYLEVRRAWIPEPNERPPATHPIKEPCACAPCQCHGRCGGAR